MTKIPEAHKHDWVQRKKKIGGGRTIIGWACSKVIATENGKRIYCSARDYVDLISS